MTAQGPDGPLQVLVVTADRAFADECSQRLPAHASIDVTVATSVGQAVDRIAAGGNVDCVVSDHYLPDTDGVAFLEAVRVQAPTLPFVLFTSEGDERVASRAISASVTEYLIKERHADQWERLAGLVVDAVRYHREYGDLVDPETRAKSLLDAARDAIAVVRDGTVEYVNQTGVNMVGAESREALVGRAVENVLIRGDDDAVSELLTAVQGNERTLDRTEAMLAKRAGVEVPVEVTATRLTWAGAPAVVLVVRDVSDRQQRERQLSLKNRAMDEAPVGITISDPNRPDNPLTYVNDRFLELTGYERAEVLGRNCRFLQGEDTREEPVAQMRAAIDEQRPVTVEVRNYRKDGTEFWNQVTIAPIRDDGGEVTHYVGFQMDVTDRKESERSLRRFRRAAEAAGHAIYITDAEGTITYVNPAFERITGYDAETAVGRNPRILKSGEMSEGYYEDLWSTLLAGEVWEEEVVNRRASGERYHARQTIAPLTDDGDEVQAFVAVQTDITEAKERERYLRNYRLAIHGASDLIAALDADLRFLFANPAYRDFHDIDAEDVTELSLPEVLGAEGFELAKPHLDRARGGETVSYRMTRHRDDKSDRTFDIRYYPLELDDGDLEGVVATMRDVTDQEARDRHLKALDRMLRHNLRNELNLVVGHAELIEAAREDAVARRAAKIRAAADRLLSQSDKEREIVECLAEPPTIRPVGLGQAVGRAIAAVRETHPEAEIDASVPASLELATVPKIGRAIRELVENAVVHGDGGPVTVDVADRGDAVAIEVVDQGPGVPAQEQSAITGDADVDPLLHSSGMGLWLVSRIVARAGGKLSFEDADDGSRVRIVLPRRRASIEDHEVKGPDGTGDGD